MGPDAAASAATPGYNPQIQQLYPIRDNNGREPAANVTRHEVLKHLDAAGLTDAAFAYSQCQDPEHFRFLLCPDDPDHFLKPAPYTCHLRICPDCARREHRRLVARWRPLVSDAVHDAPRYFKPTHIVFTSWRSLYDDDITEHFAPTLSAVHTSITRYFETLRKVARYEVHKAAYEKKKTGMARYHLCRAIAALRADPLARRLWLRLRRLHQANKAWWFNRLKRKLAAGASLKQMQIGYLVGAEFGETTQHLHMHVLYFGPFIEHDIITAIWQAEADAKVVHFNGTMPLNTAVDETLKYATKLSELPPALIPKLHQVLKGHRRVRAYGLFHGLTAKEKKAVCECPVCGHRLALWSEERYETFLDDRAQAAAAQEVHLKTGNKSERAPPPQQKRLPDFAAVSTPVYH